MRRKGLSHEDLDRIIKLRQVGTSWLKIERETGISRRFAKRVYDEWQGSQKLQGFKEARKDAAAQAFCAHVNFLMTFAKSLVRNLNVRSYDELSSAEEFFTRLYQQDLLDLCPIYDDLQEGYTLPETHDYTIRGLQSCLTEDRQSYILANELLLKSLHDHTCEEVRWKALDEWKEAMDRCDKNFDKLRKETTEGVNNFVNQERQTNLLQSIKEASREDDPTKCMAEAVLKGIWRGIREDKLDQEYPLFEIVSQGSGTAQIIKVKCGDRSVLEFTDSTNMSLAEKVSHICNLSFNNLCKVEKHLLELLQNDVRTMENTTKELREMLNPLKLHRMILLTDCDLCK